jgi:hypothetical protein
VQDEKHKQGEDGLLQDGVSYYAADARQLETYVDASRQLASFQAPVLVLPYLKH